MSDPEEHLTYVSIRNETDGSLLGTPWCEKCGPLGKAQYLDTHRTELHEIADLHWVNS